MFLVQEINLVARRWLFVYRCMFVNVQRNTNSLRQNNSWFKLKILYGLSRSARILPTTFKITLVFNYILRFNAKEVLM